MRGGKRENAGRKKGSVGKRTQEVIAKAEELGCDPVEALLELTAWAIKEWRNAENGIARIPFGEAAADWASKAAPYVRPKLASVEVEHSGSITRDAPELSDSELANIAAAGSDGAIETPASADGPDRVH